MAQEKIFGAKLSDLEKMEVPGPNPFIEAAEKASLLGMKSIGKPLNEASDQSSRMSIADFLKDRRVTLEAQLAQVNQAIRLMEKFPESEKLLEVVLKELDVTRRY